MTTELATASAQTMPEAIGKEKIASYLEAMGLAKTLTKQETTQFIEICQAFNLNPFIREIYATKYGSGEYAKFSIIVGYEVYLKRAERSGMLTGWNVTTQGSLSGQDLRGIVTIYRRDWNQPLIHEVYYSEYVQTTYDKSAGAHRPNKMWSEKPITMIKKVAIAQGFRMAFSVELGGIPYTSDEIPTVSEQAAQSIAQESANNPAPKALPRIAQAEAAAELMAKGQELLTAWKAKSTTLTTDANEWTAHLAELGSMPGIRNSEKIAAFQELSELGFEQGLDYDKATKRFYEVEPTVEQESEHVETNVE